MGAGSGGNFGNTAGSKLNYKELLNSLSDFLTLASTIPGIDTFADLAAIPVDLLRGDFLSAGLDAFGMLPLIGEVADVSKLAKLADKSADVAKLTDKASTGNKLLSKVSNTKLRNTIKELYRPGAKIGDGGLSDAIRHEIKTGQMVGGKSHIQKGKERLKNLEKILNKEPLSKQERKIVEDLIKDLKHALGGK